MRRDVFVENDSGGLSVIAAAAAEAIVDDQREDDQQFVAAHQAMLIELVGDDALPVRIVVAEPLLAEEEAQWLGRASWRIDAPDGRLLVMGGFDPDVLGEWLDEHAPGGDGRGVAVVEATPGSWRVDVYAHVGSMNGRQLLEEAGEPMGAFFRRCHPGRPHPVWLAKRLDFSGEDDPGHEELWGDVASSVAGGDLALDTSSASAVGFLIHVTPFDGDLPELPAGGWFGWETGRRAPETFPLGLPAAVPDRELEAFLDRALARPRPQEVLPVARDLVGIIESWRGDALKPLSGGGERPVAPREAFHLYWLAGLADSSPRYELWVTAEGWTPPEPTAQVAVVAKGRGVWALGPPPNSGGWFSWWSARQAAESLVALPEGSTLDLAMAQDPDEAGEQSPIGRMLFSGAVRQGEWRVAEASPAVALDVLDAALRFVEDLSRHGRLSVHGDAERRAFDAVAAFVAREEGELVWDGDSVSVSDGDERSLLLLAEPVFRIRFGEHWPTVRDDDEEEEDPL